MRDIVKNIPSRPFRLNKPACNSLFLALLSFILAVSEVHAQRTITTEAGASLRLYSPEDGIPSNSPRNGFVTNDGNLWLSTTGGTVRISGNEIEDFGADFDIPPIEFAYYDPNRDDIWFTGFRSLIHFDGHQVVRFDGNDGFTPPGGARKLVRALLADQQGRLWAGSFTPPLDTPYNGGLLLFENGHFRTVPRNELPLHNIKGLYEASDGSIWLTSYGYRDAGFNNNHSWVARYDGDAFEIFDSPDDCANVALSFRAPYGVTTDILEDNHGNLWFNCYGAYNPAANERKGKGLYRFNGHGFEQMESVNSRLIDDLQFHEIFYNDETDVLYVSLNRTMGLSAEEAARSVLVYRNGNWEEEIIAEAQHLEELSSVIAGEDQIIYFGFYHTRTRDGRDIANLQFVERFTNRFHSIIFIKEENEWRWMDTIPGFLLMNLHGDVFLTVHSEPDVIGVYTPPFSRLLTEEDGLLKSPDDGGQFFTDRDDDDGGQFFIDRGGNVWLTYGNRWDNETRSWNAAGVSMWDGSTIRNFTTADGFSSNHIFRPFQSADGTLWFPSESGVNRVTQNGSTFQISPVYGPDQQPFRSTAVAERTDGEIFTYTNLVAPETDQNPAYPFFLGRYNGEYFEPYAPPYPDSLIALPYQSYELTADRGNRLWLIARFSADDPGLFTARSHLRILEGDSWVDPGERWQVPETRLYYVGELDNGRYFVVDGGFYKFDFDEMRFIDLSDSTNANADFRSLQRVWTGGMFFHIEGSEHLYIRFRDIGISVFDGTNLTYLDRRNGLSSLRLSYPNRDRNGDMLFTTPTGGVIFNGTEFTAIRDNAVSDGASRAIARDKNGNILILYQGMGMTVTQMDTTRYPVRLASIRADTLQFFEGQTAALKANQNHIEFRFATLNFTNPDDVSFSAMLEGFDTAWSRPSKINHAEYRNLPPGDYTYRLRSVSPGNILSDEATFAFTIAPPWWRTLWAYAFYLILFGGAVFAVDRVQRRRLINREREKARERELAQAKEIEKAYHQLEEAHEHLKSAQDQLVQQEKLASLGQLTAGIAHEIKNPLNFVNNFSELSMEMIEEAREEVKSVGAIHELPLQDVLDILDDIEANLRKIHKHGSRADGIVKSMLQHSRGGSGKMEPTDLNALIKEFVNLAFHGMRAGKNPINVDIQLDLDETIGEVPLIGEDFSRVILNLCNNAFDACSERSRSTVREKLTGDDGSETGGAWYPKLSVRTKSENGKITIEVEDNGSGIPEDIKDKILQPFFTTKKGTQGTGLGLSITDDIVKAHGGTLDIQSKEDEFTLFKVTLLLNGK